MNCRRLSAVALLFSATALFGQSNSSEFVRDAVGQRADSAPPRLARQVAIDPAAVLDSAVSAMPEKVIAMEEHNASGVEPVQNGIGRSLVDPVNVEVTGAAASKTGPVPLGRGVIASSARGVVWSGNVRMNGAQRLRLHLSNVKLPADAVLWVYGGDDSKAFGKELIDPAGGLWTPSAWGDTIHLEVEVPSGATASFTIDQVLELFDRSASTHNFKSSTNDTPSCLQDVTCISSTALPLAQVEAAIAHLEFVEAGSGYVCTGGLINDKPTSHGNPAYLVTANHCISDQTTASTLQAFWDWKFANCASTAIPSLSTVPSSTGSTLLATSDHNTGGSDVTLLRLNSIPANRILLGWTTSSSGIGAGATLYRISHPAPDGFGPLPQMYSTTTVTSTGPRCTSVPAPTFIYSSNLVGGTYGGSSGSPVMLANGTIVGQLYGGCAPTGHDPGAGCDPAVLNVDGGFAADYATVKPYIDPGSGGTQTCVDSDTVACLTDGGVFAVHVDWKDFNGNTGQGHAIKYTPKSALFWFFGSDNIEMVVKMLNACSIGSTYWFFSAATTNVQYTVYVTSMKTGVTKTYVNPLGTLAAANADTGAFDRNTTCP